MPPSDLRRDSASQKRTRKNELALASDAGGRAGLWTPLDGLVVSELGVEFIGGRMR